jgi:hypothetical protein
MLVSLDKNKWLFDWMQDNWQKDIYDILLELDPNVPRPNILRNRIARLLEQKGYKTKVTSKHDVIISIPDEDFIFLKLKYL